MENKKHWQSFGELSNSAAYRQSAKDEFNEELPFEAGENSNFLETPAPRRDFLKYLGFSTAAAALAASCEIPVKKAVPFVNKPENMIPGVAQWYATTYVQDGDVVSVLAKVRDGRPIKIEGNNLSPITMGGTSARAQASVLDLYDTARIRKPMIKGSGNKFKDALFESVDNAVMADLAAAGGKAVVILTSSVTSPSTKDIINQFLAKYPGSRHVTYDAVSCSGMLLANEQTGHGRKLPSYRFDRAQTIVSLAADFLGNWLSPVEFNKQYAKGRKIDEKNPVMSKHFQFEPVMSMTGANADERYLCLPSQLGMVAAALLGAVSGQGGVAIADKALADGIARAAAELKKGGGLVVCGSNDVNVQVIVNAINAAIGANGTTIDWSVPVNYRQGIDNDMATLVADMKAGTVGALLVHGANPAYSWVDAAGFTDAIKNVPVTVSFNPKMDETAKLCKYIIPDHHYLESWGDAEPKAGHYSFIQPTIYPLFKTRQWQDSLLKWSGNDMPYAAFLKQYWSAKSGGEAGWDKILRDGILSPGGASMAGNATGGSKDSLGTSTPAPVAIGGGGSYNGGAVASAVAAATARKGGNYELFLYQKVGIGNGNGASNPWLQELPDPVTRATWDNYVIVSPVFAKEVLGIDLQNSGQADRYEAYPDKPVLEVSVNGKSVKLPALIIPGTHPKAIGIAVGYGRIESVGKATVFGDKDANIGNQNVYPFATWSNGTVDYANYNVSVKDTGDTYKVALTQTHNTYDTGALGKRTEVMKEMSLASFRQHPTEILDEREAELKPWGGLKDFEKKGTIYPYHDKPGLKWGMSIDLNSCTGCHACVVACHVENNVPVVGKNEVMRFHDMHWLRIDRYYSGDMNNPDVVFQPMLCQHCDNAPCENVCPVAATMHNQEGVNQMAYNRCIGTRYCANNCPYKVRRFNWADYMGADSFPDNHDEWDDFRISMNDPLTRMVLNPDVVVRSRGVMEKCSFCVQRTQEGKLQAKKESRPLVTGEGDQWDVKTACQQACPTDAIVFGNVHSKDSAITQHRAMNIQRTYHSLEQLHTLPNVNYLAKVRNTDRMEESGAESGGDRHEDVKHEGGNATGTTH
ncbi:MAG TPA: TAT-variant-translocated molybdopterin oxidoreductase [Chitinophagaceae bacterium]